MCRDLELEYRKYHFHVYARTFGWLYGWLAVWQVAGVVLELLHAFGELQDPKDAAVASRESQDPPSSAFSVPVSAAQASDAAAHDSVAGAALAGALALAFAAVRAGLH